MTRSISEVAKALRYKLNQAKFFLDRLGKEIDDERATGCHFSACIGALRSVPAYIRAALEEKGKLPKSKCEGDAAWGVLHRKLCKKMSEDERKVGKWLREVANTDIHRSPAELLKEIYGGYFPKDYFPPSYFPADYFPSGGVRFSAANPRSGESRDVIGACQSGISYATALIDCFVQLYSDSDTALESGVQTEPEA